MDSSRFDELTKALATATSRRQALKTITATTLGGILGLSGIGSVFAKSTCKPNGHGCGMNKQCCSGYCDPTTSTCGCPSGQTLCGGTCVNTQNDLNNCGSCGNVCTTIVANATATCTSGVCGFVCNSGYKTCNGTCIPNDQCCGGCPSGQSCQSGQCAPCIPLGGTGCNQGVRCCSGGCLTYEDPAGYCCDNC